MISEKYTNFEHSELIQMKRIKHLKIRMMKRMLTLLFLCVSVVGMIAQITSKGDFRTSNQNVVIKIEGNQNGWVNRDNDVSSDKSTPALGNENVSYNVTSEGIYFTINNGTNKIKLFALTGQLLLDGDLTQGRFFIPTRKGIYFLKINAKSYKVVCK
jgi:hypothetical protein